MVSSFLLFWFRRLIITCLELAFYYKKTGWILSLKTWNFHPFLHIQLFVVTYIESLLCKTYIVICLFLIAAVALLGIGYSAISYRLDIKGSVSSVQSTEDFHVEFVNAELGSTLPEGVTCVPTIDATKIDATLNISGLSNNGQEVVAYFKVQNNSKDIASLDATLKDLVIVVTKDDVAVDSDKNSAANIFEGNYIKVSAEFADRADAAEKEATGTVAADGLSAEIKTADSEYVWVKVTVKVIGSFTAETTHGITVHFNAESK